MWHSQIFWRLFGTYGALLVVALGSLGWALLSRMEHHHLDQIRRSLEMKAVLVQELACGDGLTQQQRQQKVKRLAEQMNSRITLIAGNGMVLADSAENPEHMKSHLDRPEVRQAEQQGVGAATRFSGTMYQPMMYVARRADQGAVGYVRIALPLDTVEMELRRLRYMVWTGTAVSVLAALVLSVVLARRVIAPLVELAAAARSMAETCLGQKVHVTSHDEIGTLATAFNEMSQACAAHIAQMDNDRQQLRAIFRNMTEGVLVLNSEQQVQFVNESASRLLHLPADSSQGRKLWQMVRHSQLAAAVVDILSSDEPYQCELEWHRGERKVLAVHGSRLPGVPFPGAVLVVHDITQLRHLERVRQDFVTNVSHELKTPLATIQATVETLLDGAIHDPIHNMPFLGSIRDNADRLHQLIQDLLTLSRIESGADVMELQPVSIRETIEACVLRHERRATAKELRLEQAPPAGPLTAMVDEEALAEILDNLVDNAIKYTPKGGQIVLRWFAEHGDAVVQVEDTGIGIADKDLSRVFERFYRVDRARSRELGGTGLGLSIVKHLVQALGGSIATTSQIGTGSTFTVRLPLVASDAGVPPTIVTESA